MRASTSARCASSWRSWTGAASCGGPEPMVERALILALAAVAVAVSVLAVRWWSRRGLARLRTAPVDGLWTALGTSPDGRPSLVVFSTPSCATCRTAQSPAVEVVEANFGAALRILKVDLTRKPDAAA